MEETARFDTTPVQFAILNALIDEPGEDQITLSARVAFDPATLGSVIGRLERKGWIRREADAADRRRKLLWITPEGEELILQLQRAVRRAQQRILGPLDGAERTQFGILLGKLVAGHEAAARDVAIGLGLDASAPPLPVTRTTRPLSRGQASKKEAF